MKSHCNIPEKAPHLYSPRCSVHQYIAEQRCWKRTQIRAKGPQRGWGLALGEVKWPPFLAKKQVGCTTNSGPCRRRKNCKSCLCSTVVCRSPSPQACTPCTCLARRVRDCKNIRVLKKTNFSYGNPRLVCCNLCSLEFIGDLAALRWT